MSGNQVKWNYLLCNTSLISIEVFVLRASVCFSRKCTSRECLFVFRGSVLRRRRRRNIGIFEIFKTQHSRLLLCYPIKKKTFKKYVVNWFVKGSQLPVKRVQLIDTSQNEYKHNLDMFLGVVVLIPIVLIPNLIIPQFHDSSTNAVSGNCRYPIE